MEILRFHFYFNFRFVAERGNSTLLSHVDNIDLAFNLRDIKVRSFPVHSHFVFSCLSSNNEGESNNVPVERLETDSITFPKQLTVVYPRASPRPPSGAKK